MPTSKSSSATFLVVDAMLAPHGGRILRLTLKSGQAPSIKELKGARMRAVSPDGAAERMFRVEGFAVFGGKLSDRRFSRTGRVDVHVTEESGDGPEISLGWAVSGPLPS